MFCWFRLQKKVKTSVAAIPQCGRWEKRSNKQVAGGKKAAWQLANKKRQHV